MNQSWRVAAALVLVWALGALPSGAQPVTPNQNFINRIYLDLLGRPPTAGELATTSGLLDNATLSRSQFASSLTSGGEFLTGQVGDFYQLLLRRPPTPVESTPLVNTLGDGQTFEQVQAIIAGSNEYFTSRGGGTNEGFLDAVFADELNRPIDPQSRAGYLSLLNGGTSRTQVTGFILNSNEYRNGLVNAYYNEFLRRPPSVVEATGGVNALSGLTDQRYLNSLLASAEYFNLAQTLPEPSCAAAGMIALPLLMIRRRRRR